MSDLRTQIESMNKESALASTRNQRFQDLLDDIDGSPLAPITQSQVDEKNDVTEEKKPETKNDIPQEIAKLPISSHPSTFLPPAKSLTHLELNTDELLEQFLEVARAEIAQTKKQITDDNNVAIRNLLAQLSASITKSTASSDVNIRKLSSQIQEISAQLSNDISKTATDNRSALKQIHLSNAEVQDKIRSLESRVDSMSTAQKIQMPIQKISVGADGKVELEPVIQQMAALNHLSNDLNSRLSIIERKDFIHPSAFASALESIQSHETRLNEVESITTNMNLRFAEMKQALELLNHRDTSDEEKQRYQELKDRMNAIEEENKRISENNVKFNKDLVAARAAINTLRTHSEDASSAIDDMRKLTDNVREEGVSMEKRLKKVVAFVQSETNNLTAQINDLAKSIERSEDKIEDLLIKQVELSKKVSSQTETTAVPVYFPTVQIENTQRPTIVNTVIEKNTPQQNNSPIRTPPTPEMRKVVTPSYLEETQPSKKEESTLTSQSLQLLDVVGSVENNQNISPNQTPNTVVPLKPPKLKSAVSHKPEVTRGDLKKYDELFTRILTCENALLTIQSLIESANRQIRSLDERKADKEELRTLFEQFRLAMSELNNRVTSLKKQIQTKVEQKSFEDFSNDVNKRMKTIEESLDGAKSIASKKPPSLEDSVIVRQARPNIEEGESCFIYGERGNMYYGRSQNGKPIVTKQENK